jgi:hypothetical protein
MLSYLLILSLINIAFTVVYAYEPSCVSCKWFIGNKVLNTDLGLCRMFKESYSFNDNIVKYNYALHCRENEKLCGNSGFLYEPIERNVIETSETNEILNDYDELSNRCCGEVNETDELEQLERDFLEIFQKIKKHNKKRIFNASKDLYNFFRKSD